jgi:hypothetical protein
MRVRRKTQFHWPGATAEAFLYRSPYLGFERFCGLWRPEIGLSY